MKYQINTSIIINTTPDRVWQVLTDFSSYHLWNQFVKSVTGKVAEGKQIDVQVDDMKFTPIVQSFETNKAFVWQGKLWVRGLFDGEHSFKLQDNKDGTTTFIHSENFKGL